MKKSRYTETQIVKILKEVEAGRLVKEVCREYSIADATYYNLQLESQIWRYGGVRYQTTQGVRRRESSFEADVCRVEPGSQDS